MMWVIKPCMECGVAIKDTYSKMRMPTEQGIILPSLKDIAHNGIVCLKCHYKTNK